MKNVWRSKLSATAYPQANPDGKLTGKDHEQIDPVFAKRLAACCAISLTDGKRSSARQTDLYDQFIEWKRTGKGDIHSAARPGTSWHEFGLAIDTSSQPIRGMNNSQLAKFGLCKPIKSEGWHVQPIETMRLGIDASTAKAKALHPVDLAPTVKMMYGLADDTVDYLAAFPRAVPLFEGLIAKRKGFSAEVISYIKAYEYGDALMARLGL